MACLIDLLPFLAEGGFPNRPDWFVIVSRIGRDRKPFISATGNGAVIGIIFPLRNFETGDAQ